MQLACCWCRFLPVLCVSDCVGFGFCLIVVDLRCCGLSIWLFVFGIWFRFICLVFWSGFC